MLFDAAIQRGLLAGKDQREVVLGGGKTYHVNRGELRFPASPYLG